MIFPLHAASTEEEIWKFFCQALEQSKYLEVKYFLSFNHLRGYSQEAGEACTAPSDQSRKEKSAQIWEGPALELEKHLGTFIRLWRIWYVYMWKRVAAKRDDFGMKVMDHCFRELVLSAMWARETDLIVAILTSNKKARTKCRDLFVDECEPFLGNEWCSQVGNMAQGVWELMVAENFWRGLAAGQQITAEDMNSGDQLSVQSRCASVAQSIAESLHSVDTWYESNFKSGMTPTHRGE